MNDTPIGWDTSLSRLFDFFEGLPPVLKAIGPRKFGGAAEGFRFHLDAVAGRLELHVKEAGWSRSELFIADARRLSERSPLRPFIELDRRLSSFRAGNVQTSDIRDLAPNSGSPGGDLGIADILDGLAAIRKTYSLQSSDDGITLTGSQHRQMAYLWDRARLDASHLLKLDAPFEISNDEDDAIVWCGAQLPLALGSLRPTLGIIEIDRRTTFYVEVVERVGSVIGAHDPSDEHHSSDPSDRAELDAFASRLGTLAAQQEALN